MPPFQSRSTGAARIAFISSAGVTCAAPPSMPSADRTSALTGTDLAVRGYTPPPAEISEWS